MPRNTSDYDIKIIDGEKSVKLEDLPPEAWRVITGTDVNVESLKKLYTAVPWLFRGIDIRANAMAKVPFSISKGENVIDTSTDYKNIVGFWPKPFETLSLIEASLTLTGRAYLLKAENQFGFLKVLRYLVPTTVTPKIDNEIGLTHFERSIGGVVRKYTLEELAWFWLRDAFTEIGPPDTSPAKAAMRAAGVLFNVDSFVDAFFKRGAIKAMLLAVPKGTPKGERQKLKAWYRRLFEGISKAWATAVVSEKISTTIVGEGIQELSNTNLTKEKREDIAVAIGVPQNILFSDDANFATAKQEDFRLYDLTITAEVRLIEGVLNVQVFEPQGFSIKFHPQSLQIFQEEEVNRSAALVNLVRSDIPTVDAMQILGYDLPADMDFDELEKNIQENMELKASLRIPSGNLALDQSPNTPVSFQRTAQSVALDKYKSHAIKRFKNGKSIKGTKDAPKFDSEDIPNTLKAAIGGALNRAKSKKDINRIFADAQKSETMHNITWEGYP
jgi:phage portal protein BeeE